MKRINLSVTVIILSLVIAVINGGCSSQNAPSSLELAPLADMPAEVQASPVSVQEAYRFAFANPDVLTQIPCYCGCGSMGHTSNYACYVSGENDDGSQTFESHALGCSICVDITQDTMRLLDEGKSVADTQVYIDQSYSQYGPSNIP